MPRTAEEKKWKRTSGLVNRHNGTTERGIRVLEVRLEGAQRETGRDDARVTGNEDVSTNKRNIPMIPW